MIFVRICVEISHDDTLEIVFLRLFYMIHNKFGESFTLTGKVLSLVCIDIYYLELFSWEKEVYGDKPAILLVNSLNVLEDIQCYDKTNTSRSIQRIKIPV